MPEQNGHEPTQETEQGLTIPVPTRDEIEDALAKVAEPDVAPDPSPKRRFGRRPK
jgi:hypothetical protein